MSWSDRDYGDDPSRGSGRPGGDWQGIRPSWDNPLTWSFSMGSVGGIDIRIHVAFVIFAVIQLLLVLPGASVSASVPLSLMLTGAMIAALFVIVLLHEFGHCLACRRCGGEANEILMWPLGGLAFCRPPHRWKAHLITVVGGPVVNVIIAILTGAILIVTTGVWWEVVVPNPARVFGGLYLNQVSGSAVLQILLIFHVVNLMLLVFNLLPAFPMDGGRIVQAVLWPKLGYVRSMRIATRVGYVGAIVLVVYGIFMSQLLLVFIAIFCGIVCYQTNRQLNFTEQMLGAEAAESPYDYGLGDADDDAWRETAASTRPTREERQAEKQAELQESEARLVDDILAKIAQQGMGSLSARERRLLKQASERKRQESS